MVHSCRTLALALDTDPGWATDHGQGEKPVLTNSAEVYRRLLVQSPVIGGTNNTRLGNTMRMSRIILAVTLPAVIPANCLANSACPGPLMYFGAMNTGVGVWWIVMSMLTCTLIEGALYQVMHIFRRPYLVSIILNTVSLLVGIPLTFVGALVDFMLTATVLSIIAETLVAGGMVNMRTVKGVVTSNGRTTGIVLCANVLSNIVLVFLLAWMTHLYPPRWTYERECRRNTWQLREAALTYAHDNSWTNRAPISPDALLQYLPNKHMPLCPFGGTYTVYVDERITCSHSFSDKPKRHNIKPNHATEATDRKLAEPQR